MSWSTFCNDDGMTDRVALVTGAGRGIGAAAVTALVRDGWRVAALDSCRDDPRLRYPMATAEELAAVVGEHEPDRVMGLHADVADQRGMHDAVADVIERFGRLDAAVAAAGVPAGGGPVWEASDAEWEAVLAIDLTGVFHTIRAAVPAILEQGSGGRIVSVASAAGSLGLHHMAPYAAAKHGVIGLTRSLAADLAGTGVTANVVSPGSTSTAALEASAAVYGFDDPKAFIRHQEPLGRLIEPAEVAAAVAWLCSAASAAITGAVVPVDGGMTATP